MEIKENIYVLSNISINKILISGKTYATWNVHFQIIDFLF